MRTSIAVFPLWALAELWLPASSRPYFAFSPIELEAFTISLDMQLLITPPLCFRGAALPAARYPNA